VNPARGRSPCSGSPSGGDEQTDVAVVLVHGLTNCPRQFLEFGESL
jgi:hypothetical protein